MNTMNFEHETFDIHGVFVCGMGWGCPDAALPAGDSRRYDEQFWKELLGGGVKRSKEQNLPVPSPFDGEGVGVLDFH